MSMSNDNERILDLQTRLRELYEQNASELETFAWVSEAERWGELVFCLLSLCTKQDPQVSRTAVQTLQTLGLLEPNTLASVSKGRGDPAVVLSFVLRQCGFEPAEAEKAVTLLADAAEGVRRVYGGKIQRCLRVYGAQMREGMLGTLKSDAVTEDQLRYALTLWLQNALSLPLSLEHEAVKHFCEASGATIEDLQRASDALDLNLALVDDLLDMARDAKQEPFA
jgi:hypothetical protein